MPRPRITVVLPTYNRERFIATALESLLEQSLPPAQVLVVDDGSTDQTPIILGRYKDRIELILKENGGKSSAINQALPRVSGDYLWVFDDDDVACPDAIERHVAFLEANPQLGFSMGASYYCNNDPVSDHLVDCKLTRVPGSDPGDHLVPMMLTGYSASPVFMVRTELQNAVGPYREELVRCQDFDMALRWSMAAEGGVLPGDDGTYFRRFHTGVRGPKGHEFNYQTQDSEKFRTFDRLILRELHPAIPVTRFLPRNQWNDESSGALFRAHARRLAVRLHKGLWPEAIEDLEEMTSLGDPGILMAAEKKALLKCLEDPRALRDLRNASSSETRRWRRALGQPCTQEIRLQLGRALYYTFHREQNRHGFFSQGAEVLKLAHQLLGPRNAVRLLSQKLIGSITATS